MWTRICSKNRLGRRVKGKLGRVTNLVKVSIMNHIMKFRKKPVTIEAIQYIPHETCALVAEFIGEYHDPEACMEEGTNPNYVIHTLEGDMEAAPGDWIIKGVQGEFYPCKPDIFEQTYEKA